jgi:hypothetical protein
LKLGYEYINDGQVRKFDISPCSERFNNVFAAALQMSDCQNPRRVIIRGIAGLIDSRNSATSTSMTDMSEYLLSHHILRVLIMHLQLLYECPTPPRIQGG